MSVETILFVLVIVLVIGALPSWPYSKSWGFTPSSALTVALIIFLVWATALDRPLFRRSGHDLRSAGREVASSIRDAVQ
jgi:MFS superfamily sulfate permease-like transporter